MAEGEHLDIEWENQLLESEIQDLEEDDNEDDNEDNNDIQVNIEIDTGDKPEARLSRFLYLGKEYNNYQPGYWFVHNYFLVTNVPSIDELASDEKTQLVPIDLITKAFESNLVPHPEILVFALAVCCKQNKSEKLRHAAYKSTETICASPQNFILFVKFVSKLSKENELCFVTHGWGRGLRKAVNNWYLSKEPLVLAKYVTRYKSRYGWKHKDIIKMSHPQINDQERAVIMKYIMHGMQKTREFLGDKNDDANINKILEHLQGVEDFKHCEDEIAAAAILERYELSLDHVPGHLLKAKEVWNSLIPSMEITTLLNNLQRINNLELLKQDELAVEKVTGQLMNSELIVNEKIHPALLLITLKNYENSGKPLTYEKRKIKETARKHAPLPPEPNPKVINALHEAFYASFAHLQATNLRYLVTIKTTKTMEDHVWQGGNVTGLEAASLIAMMLLRCENNVEVGTFKNNGIYLAYVTKNDTLEEIMKALKKPPVMCGELNKPILWAAKEKKEFDVFINIVDQLHDVHELNENKDESQEALIKYRNELGLPKTKLINCVVCSPTYRKKPYDKNILTINGFDATVPLVIQAFSQSLF